ncbi:hypothetical protein HDU78_006972 [Chytriomyces hyalinus]|nr:hypothetical protein HDU78_006972 [Chytriomyces hyalinus]
MQASESYSGAEGSSRETGRRRGSSSAPATAAADSLPNANQCDPANPASKDPVVAADVTVDGVRMEAVVHGRTLSIPSSHISFKNSAPANGPKQHPNAFHPYKRSFHTSFHANNAPASPPVQIMPQTTSKQETNSSRSIMEQDDSLLMSPQAADDSDAHMFAASPVAGDDEELGNAKIPAPLHDQHRSNQLAAPLPYPQTRSRMHQQQPATLSECVRSNPLRIPGSNSRIDSELKEPPELIQKADPAAHGTPATDPDKIQDAKDLAAFAAWVTLRLIGRRWSLLMEQKTAAAASAGVSGHSNSVYGVSNSPGVSMSGMHSSYIPSSQLSSGVSLSAVVGPGAAAVGNFSTFANNIQPSAYVAGSVAGSLYIPSSSPNRFQQHQQPQTHTPIIHRQLQPASFTRGTPPNGQRPLLNRFGAASQNVHPVMGYRDDRIDSVTTVHSVGSQRRGSSYFQQQQSNSQYAPSFSTPLIPQVHSRQNSAANLMSNVSMEPSSSLVMMGGTASLPVPEGHFLSPTNSPNMIQQGNASARFASPASGLQQSPSPGVSARINDLPYPQGRNAGSSASTIVSDCLHEDTTNAEVSTKSSNTNQKTTTLPPLNQILDAQNIRLPSILVQNPQLHPIFESDSSSAGGSGGGGGVGGSGRPLPPFGQAPRYASSSQYSAATLPLPRHVQMHGRSQSSYTAASNSSMLSSPNPPPQFLQPTNPQQQQQQQQQQQPQQSTRHTLPPSYISHYTSRLTRLATLTLLKTPTPPHTTLLALHLLRRLISTPKPLPTRISTPTRMLLACLMVADSLFGGERGVPSRVWGAIAKVSGLKDGGDDGDTTSSSGPPPVGPLTDAKQQPGGSTAAAGEGGLGFIAGMKKDVLVALGFHLHASVVGYTEWMQTLKDLLKDGDSGGDVGSVTGASVDMKRRTKRILDDLSVGEGRLGMDWKW